MTSWNQIGSFYSFLSRIPTITVHSEVVLSPSKRQSLIPFPRVGRSSSPDFDFDSTMARESRASSDRAFHRRLLRSVGDFKRRITRSGSEASGSSGARSTRSRSSQGSTTAFTRRILREASTGQAGFRRRITKKQSLIPFPRTGKRSGAPGEQERDQVGTETVGDEIFPFVFCATLIKMAPTQVYIYEEEDQDPEEGLGDFSSSCLRLKNIEVFLYKEVFCIYTLYITCIYLSIEWVKKLHI